MKTFTSYTAETAIRDAVQAFLEDDHKVDGVQFVDRLLDIAKDIGEIKCTLVGGNGLRFELPGQEALEVKISRAKSKFRMFLPRFAVLCNESENQDVSLYGGEGIIRRRGDANAAATAKGTSLASNGPSGKPSRKNVARDTVAQWSIRFMNTLGEQFVTIHAL